MKFQTYLKSNDKTLNSFMIAFFALSYVGLSFFSLSAELYFLFILLFSFIIFLSSRDIFLPVFFVLVLLMNSYTVNFEIGTRESINLGNAMYMVFPFALIVFLLLKKISLLKVDFLLYFFWFGYLLYIFLFKSNTNFSFLIFLFSLFSMSILFRLLILDNKKYGYFLLFSIFLVVLIITFVWFIEVIKGETFFTSKWVIEERFRSGFLRAGSTVGDNNIATAIVGSIFFLVQTNAFRGLFGKNLVFFVSILFLFMIIFSFSRAAWFTFLLTLLVLISLRVKNLVFFSVIGGIAFILAFDIISFLNTLDLASSSTRIFLNNLSFNLFIENMVTGIGFGNYNIHTSVLFGVPIENSIDTINTYAYVAVSTGLIGVLFFLKYIYITIRDLIKRDNNMFFDNRDRKFVIASLTYYFIIIYNIDSFSYPLIWLFPSVVLAISYFGSKRTHVYQTLKDHNREN